MGEIIDLKDIMKEARQQDLQKKFGNLFKTKQKSKKISEDTYEVSVILEET